MRTVNIKLVDVQYHRNGIGGEGFYAITFDDKENGRMVASLFDAPGYCAVYNIDKLATNGVTFGINSWRGDVYEDALRPLVKKFMEREQAL